MSNEQGPLNVTLIKYESGLGTPGIMPPQVSSSVQISATPTGGTVTRQVYENNRPSSTQTRELTEESSSAIHSFATELTTLQVHNVPGGPDVFGANTAVMVARGNVPVWGYNPGSGCVVGPDDDQAMFTASAEDKSKFSKLISEIYQTCEAAL
ncbi:hypothetical protein IWW36_000214 [Coemansia brasiliensis]|uniref:Uncharacterized protein n=1 Tax=Coemansia brasiliensis TaxID=2650707 RepID=A0A9W8IE38_9FUNG|nr:hypothetical protein IWW36_000214 [Coemansia brasiliensis]